MKLEISRKSNFQALLLIVILSYIFCKALEAIIEKHQRDFLQLHCSQIYLL